MQIVIDIPDEWGKYINSTDKIDLIGNLKDDVAKALKSGIVLPKGHGRLIDADELKRKSREVILDGVAHTIVEADKE